MGKPKRTRILKKQTRRFFSRIIILATIFMTLVSAVVPMRSQALVFDGTATPGTPGDMNGTGGYGVAGGTGA